MGATILVILPNYTGMGKGAYGYVFRLSFHFHLLAKLVYLTGQTRAVLVLFW